jgi:uncharacterized small protein (DUF1192 family)
MASDELKALLDEVKRHMDVVAEGIRGDVRQVAEGMLTLRGEQQREFQRVWHEFDETKAMIKFSHAELDRRIATLEGRVERLEAVVLESKPNHGPA